MADDVDGRADGQCDRDALGLRRRDTAAPAVRKRSRRSRRAAGPSTNGCAYRCPPGRESCTLTVELAASTLVMWPYEPATASAPGTRTRQPTNKASAPCKHKNGHPLTTCSPCAQHNTRGAPTSASLRVLTWRDEITDPRPDRTRDLVKGPHGDKRPGILEAVARGFLHWHGVGRLSQARPTGAGGHTPRHRLVVAAVPEPGQAGCAHTSCRLSGQGSPHAAPSPPGRPRRPSCPPGWAPRFRTLAPCRHRHRPSRHPTDPQSRRTARAQCDDRDGSVTARCARRAQLRALRCYDPDRACPYTASTKACVGEEGGGDVPGREGHVVGAAAMHALGGHT